MSVETVLFSLILFSVLAQHQRGWVGRARGETKISAALRLNCALCLSLWRRA
jgi:hypothetical protein